MIDAERHVRAMALITARIKAQVVPADGLGAAPEPLSELVLRAVRMIVLAELDTLREVVFVRRHLRDSRSPRKDRARAVSWGGFWGIEDLTAYVRDELHQITDLWIAYRSTAGSERAAYRTALREAQAFLHELGTASEFSRFLRTSQTRTDRPALQATCARMSAALTLRIDVDPDRPLIITTRPLHERTAERAA